LSSLVSPGSPCSTLSPYTTLFRSVFIATFVQSILKLAQQVLLLFTQAHWGLHMNVAIQITRITRAYTANALAAQAESLARLGSFGNGNFTPPCQSRYLDVAS